MALVIEGDWKFESLGGWKDLEWRFSDAECVFAAEQTNRQRKVRNS